jgi:hypothetical protein
MRRRLVKLGIVFVALLLALLPVSQVFAATSQDVTVTASPAFIGIANAPSTWTLNGITGGGKANINTTYYANPLGDTTAPSATVVDGECRFTITNTSTIATDLTVNIGHFTGGDAMQNGDTGANGANQYGAYSWCSGMLYSGKVIAKTTGSGVMKDALAATTNIKWGAEILTQTDAWSSASDQTATMTITATAD